MAFHVTSFRILHGIGDAPQSRVESEHPTSFIDHLPAIEAVLYPVVADCWAASSRLNGDFFEATDYQGDPFVATAGQSSIGSVGGSWGASGFARVCRTRSHTARGGSTITQLAARRPRTSTTGWLERGMGMHRKPLTWMAESPRRRHGRRSRLRVALDTDAALGEFNVRSSAARAVRRGEDPRKSAVAYSTRSRSGSASRSSCASWTRQPPRAPFVVTSLSQTRRKYWTNADEKPPW